MLSFSRGKTPFATFLVSLQNILWYFTDSKVSPNQVIFSNTHFLCLVYILFMFKDVSRVCEKASFIGSFANDKGISICWVNAGHFVFNRVWATLLTAVQYLWGNYPITETAQECLIKKNSSYQTHVYRSSRKSSFSKYIVPGRIEVHVGLLPNYSYVGARKK